MTRSCSFRPTRVRRALVVVLAAVAWALPGFVATAQTDGAEAPPAMTIQEAMMRWTRSGDRSYTDAEGTAVHMSADLTLAHVTLFESGDQAVPPGVANGSEVVFFLTESIHDGDLPDAPVRFQLYVDALGPFDPVEVTLINPDPHHRTHRVVYRAPNGVDGEPPTLIGADTVNVALSAIGGTRPCESEFGYCPTGAWVHLNANPGGQDAIAFIPRTAGIFGVSCPIHPDVLGDIVVRIERHTH